MKYYKILNVYSILGATIWKHDGYQWYCYAENIWWWTKHSPMDYVKQDLKFIELTSCKKDMMPKLKEITEAEAFVEIL